MYLSVLVQQSIILPRSAKSGEVDLAQKWEYVEVEWRFVSLISMRKLEMFGMTPYLKLKQLKAMSLST